MDSVSITENCNDQDLLKKTCFDENDCDYNLSILFDENFQTINFDTNNEYARSTLVDHSISDYDLSTLFDESLETNQFYTDITIENNVHANNVENDVHDSNFSSMRAHSMMNLGLKKKGFKMGHLNVQGIPNKMEQVDLLLNSSENDIQLLGLSESKLNANHTSDFFKIRNYQLFRKDRIVSADRPEQGGGIIVYVKDEIKCERRYDLESVDIECVWLEIFQQKSKSFLVGIMYRHPNETVRWNELFDDQFDKILECEKEVYLLGDFNRDLLQENIRKPWLEYMESFGLKQIIESPTRITNFSETLIDHIYCNTLCNILSIDVPILGLSDHFPIFITRKINSFSVHKKSHFSISYRSFKNFNETEFISDLAATPWDVIKLFDDTNDTVETWSSLFLDIVNKHLPLKQHRVTHKQQPKWLTGDIIDAIKTRDRYKAINNNEQYKIWRNKVCSMIKQSKKLQYSEILNENNNNPASVWKLFKEIGASKHRDNSNISSLKIQDNIIEHPQAIVDEFNKFFVTVASKIKQPIVNSNFDKLKQFCDEKNPENNYFSIPHISQEKVEKYLKNIDISKATGSDNIGPRLLKLAAPFISDSLKHICNHSINNSTFPDKWKEGKVRPLHKSGSKDDTNNYRPISILPVISKLLEKHVHDSLMAFLTSHKLLHSTQSGFRPNHSCETALLLMINKFLEAINNSQIIGMVMVDFRKAFDLVDHILLLKKLRHYKLSAEAVNWFSSYLLNRKQKVVINNTESATENIVCGVPQGSILGPLLFLLFINDLPLYTNNVSTDLYADDTTLFQIGESQVSIERSLQLALLNLSEWCKLNGMLLNTAKTKVMIITTVQKRLHLNNNYLHLTYNDDTLKTVETEKVLGVHIDNNLTWSVHIDSIAKKISSNLWLLSKLKEYLSTEHRVQFYKTYIQPHIDYCSSIWGGTSQHNLNRIYRLQKRAVKIILNYEYDDIAVSMDTLKVLNVYERIFLRKAKFMFKISKSITPSYINQMFSLRSMNETLQSLRSTSNLNFLTPRPQKEIFKQSLIYSGPVIWNNLPDYLKNIETTDSFHKQCIRWMKSNLSINL